MTTISLSLDDRSKKQLDQIVAKTNRSRSDIVRDMIAWYELKATADAMQQNAMPLLRRLAWRLTTILQNMPPKIRVVPDSNVLIAAALNRSYCYDWLFGASEPRATYELYVSEAILSETSRKLADRFGFSRRILQNT